MSQEPLSSKLSGIIEVDETYIGGKLKIGSHATKPGERPKDALLEPRIKRQWFLYYSAAAGCNVYTLRK